MIDGARLIMEERKYQIYDLEFDAKHDDKWYREELIQAAKCYIDESYPFRDAELWPDTWDEKWFKPSSDIKNLVKAGALIAAEIDRLQRLEK